MPAGIGSILGSYGGGAGTSLAPPGKRNILLELLPLLISGGLGAAFGGQAGFGSALGTYGQIKSQQDELEEEKRRRRVQEAYAALQQRSLDEDRETRRRLEQERANRPQIVPEGAGMRDPVTGQVTIPVPRSEKEPAGFTLGTGQKRYDKEGKVIAEGPAAPEPKPPVSYQEYELAKKGGFEGTYTDYQNMDANRRRPINVQGTSGGGDDVATWADALANGEVAITAVPIKQRGAVLRHLENTSRKLQRPLNPTEKLRQESVSDMIADLDTLEQLAKENRSSIGFVEGKVAAAKRATVGASPEVNEMFRIADNLADVLLRARSGAAITPQEYTRLRALVPDPRGPETKFFSDLNGFRKELQRTLAHNAQAVGGGSGESSDKIPTLVYDPKAPGKIRKIQ